MNFIGICFSVYISPCIYRQLKSNGTDRDLMWRAWHLEKQKRMNNASEKNGRENTPKNKDKKRAENSLNVSNKFQKQKCYNVPRVKLREIAKCYRYIALLLLELETQKHLIISDL